MKKNITINLFGSLYAIDEDAYELLNQYQKNMQRYFSRQEGGEEIAEDIERRIAELFDELKASGVEAITIEHMQEIIKRIGNPEEMDNPESENLSEGTEEPHEGRKPKETIHKKLFRNPDDKMLGGVTSGLACFFGIDPLWLRLLMILFAWFSLGTMIVIYLILWIITPEAQTPEDRLRMQGRPVNMENLRDEIMEGARKAGQYATAPETKKTARGCLTVLLDIITAVFKGCLFVFIGGLILILSIVLLFALVMLCLFLISACCGGISEGVFSSSADQAFFNGLVNGSIGQGIYWIASISFIVLSVLTLYIGGHSILRMAGRIAPMNAMKRLALLGTWVVCLTVFIASAIQGNAFYERYRREFYKEKQEREDTAHRQKQLSYLKNEGWTVIRHENCDGYVKSGEYYTGDREMQYIDAWSGNRNMEYELEQTVHMAPGIYRLEAAARTDGHGCEIFAISGGKEQKTQVPIYSNEGGEIWQDAKKKQNDGTVSLGLWRNITEANGGKGYGWSTVRIDSIVTHNGTIRYGVTNIRSRTWDGTWFSATDFKLEKTGNLPQRNPSSIPRKPARHP